MEIKRVWALAYSATGNTATLVRTAAKAAADCLGVPMKELSFSIPAERAAEWAFASGDLVFIGSPTYAGKLPNKLLPDFQSKLIGNGAFAAAMVSFGNRSFDNALAELCVSLTGDGFQLLSAGAFVGQHAFATALAAERPNAEDLAEAAEFGRKTAEKAGDTQTGSEPIQVPGDADAPYYIPRGVDGEPVKFLKAKPKTDEDRCTNCGLCAEICPMGAIDPEDVFSIPGTCIKCQACVRRCPENAKYFDDPAFLSHRAMLEENYTAPQANALFI